MTDDRTLIQQCLDGHPQAYGVLIDRYQKPLYNAALRMLNNVQDAEDITQVVFVKAYEKLDTYKPKYKFFSWIYRMTVNESLNLLKRQKRFEALEEVMVAHSLTPAEHAVVVDESDRVGIALMGLNPEDRAMVLLKHFEGFSYKEIGYILEIPVKTVKSRLYTARQRLKDILLTKGFSPTHG